MSQQEDYQRILQVVLGVTEKEGPRVILVVGAVHGDGASTVARNLACSVAQKGTVLLVDANLRSPSQHLAFGVPPEGGFSELAGRLTGLDGVIKSSSLPGLSLLTCGRIPEGSESLDWAASQDVLKELRGKFDRIIIDTSPVSVYPDAAGLAKLCDGVILVLQAERTRWEVAEQVKRALEQCGCQILGVVLNRRKYHIPDWIYRRL